MRVIEPLAVAGEDGMKKSRYGWKYSFQVPGCAGAPADTVSSSCGSEMLELYSVPSGATRVRLPMVPAVSRKAMCAVAVTQAALSVTSKLIDGDDAPPL